MSRSALLFASVLLASSLAAQDAHMGLALIGASPQGAFSSSNFPANPGSNYLTVLPGNGFMPTVLTGTPATSQGYNAGLGLQFTWAFPLDRTWAVRADAAMITFNGNATAPGYPSVGLKAGVATLGCEAQAFLGSGNAMRYSGPYVFGGLSVDVGMYTCAYSDAWDDTVSTRLGGTLGLGYCFRADAYHRYTLEAGYHTTLTSTGPTDPPAATMLTFSVGMAF